MGVGAVGDRGRLDLRDVEAPREHGDGVHARARVDGDLHPIHVARGHEACLLADGHHALDDGGELRARRAAHVKRARIKVAERDRPRRQEGDGVGVDDERGVHRRRRRHGRAAAAARSAREERDESYRNGASPEDAA